MDNNNFEAKFKQSVKTSTSAQADTGHQPSRYYLIIIILLSMILLFESITLIVVMVTYSNDLELSDSEEDYQVVDESTIIDENLSYDEDGNLTSINTICTSKESGKEIILNRDNSVKEYDSTDSLIGSDTYTIIDDTLISFSDDSSRVLYFDDDTLYDGLVIYDCTYDSSSTAEE